MSEKKGESKGLRRAETSHGLTPFEEMERLFEGFFPPRWMRGWHGGWPSWSALEAPPFEGRTPRVDVIDRDEEIVVRAELPGMKKDDLDVSLAEDMLTIKAASKEESEEEEGGYHRREISRGEFTRSIRLPANVDAEKVKAKFADGILELNLPKVAPSTRHSIKVD
jgi:HSP20 family protein